MTHVTLDLRNDGPSFLAANLRVAAARHEEQGTRATAAALRDLAAQVDGKATDARPLVVIDPEDREAVERLRVDLINSGWIPDGDADALDDILRHFANPKPPRPDEPSIGGVVEASCVHSNIRLTWLRQANGEWFPLNGTTGADDWDSLRNPVLVRDGVDQ